MRRSSIAIIAGIDSRGFPPRVLQASNRKRASENRFTTDAPSQYGTVNNNQMVNNRGREELFPLFPLFEPAHALGTLVASRGGRSNGEGHWVHEGAGAPGHLIHKRF